MQFLGGFTGRFEKEETLPFGALIIGVQLPDFQIYIIKQLILLYNKLINNIHINTKIGITNLLTPFFGNSFQSILSSHPMRDLDCT